jgi:hypothetical protein
MGRLRLDSIGESHDYAVLIDAKPGSAGRRVHAGHRAHGTIEQSRRLSPACIKLLAIGSQYQGSVFNDTKE